MKLPALGTGAALLVGLFMLSPAAQANGRFPASNQIAVDPADPTHLVVRTTYGVLTTHDAGARWHWICEASIGYSGLEDPMLAITADGSILAGIFEGLSVTHDSGCQWDFIQGGLKEHYAIDLSVEHGDAKSAVVITSNSVGGSMFLTQLWESADNGGTWVQAGVDLPPAFLGLTVDTAPSDPSRVYASGRYGGPDYPGILQRSKDRGKVWEKLPITGSDDKSLPYIAAIDPTNPEVIYVRLDSVPGDRVTVSKDGGVTWTEVFASSSSILGFALSPDGATVAIGVSAADKPDVAGLWMAPAATLQFKKVSPVDVRCLTWTAQGLYVCANEFVDGFAAGLSLDQGKSFAPIMHMRELCGPLQCDAATTTGQTCPAQWQATKDTLGAPSCEPVDAGPDAGGTSSGAATSGSPAEPTTSGCSCGVPAGKAGGLLSGLALAATATLLSRRRRGTR